MRIFIASFMFAALFVPSWASAQPLKPGQWQTYTSMRSVSDIAVSSDSNFVWAATNGGVFRADLRNAQASLLALRTTDGLTENDVTSVASDAEGNIYFGEGSGGFDIYNTGNGTFNSLSDIRNQSYSNTAINDITIFRDTVYLAAGYGITVFYPGKDGFGVFGPTATQLASQPQLDSVRQVIDDGTFVYAAMYQGVVWAKNNSDLHAGSNWTFLPDSGWAVRALVNFNGKIYAGAENGLFVISANRDSLIYVPLQDSLAINRLLVANDSLYLLDESGNLYSTHDLIHLAARAISSDAGSMVTAIALARSGIAAGTVSTGIGYPVNGTFNGTIFPPGPITNTINCVHYATATDQLYITNLGSGFGLFQPKSDVWTDYQSGVGTTPSITYDQVLYDSIRNVTWFSAHGQGLYNVAGLGTSQQTWTAFNHTEIPNTDGGTDDFIITSGMALDANNNFLVTSWAGNGKGLSISSDGKNFTSDPLGFYAPWGCVTQDLNGNYWVGTQSNSAPKSQGVYWYNPSTGLNGVIYGGSSGTLGPAIEGTEYVNAVLTDQDDGIWCGTEGGVEIISDPESILQNNQTPTSIRSVQFTTNQVVHSMEVDGVGNKWIGTEDGIFVVSADGSDSIAHFTAENSPLVNDIVTSIAIDPTRGEAYAGTPAGISRFSTIFKRGEPDYSGIRIYPNPVVQTADQSPTVFIDGLVAGSTVQIFSLAGQLIRSIDGTQLGSIVTWNGRDALGRQVPSGMYLVSATSPQAGGNGEAKVVIVRKPSN
jgi:ligand-binding sensor domain-containing protein